MLSRPVSHEFRTIHWTSFARKSCCLKFFVAEVNYYDVISLTRSDPAVTRDCAAFVRSHMYLVRKTTGKYKRQTFNFDANVDVNLESHIHEYTICVRSSWYV